MRHGTEENRSQLETASSYMLQGEGFSVFQTFENLNNRTTI